MFVSTYAQYPLLQPTTEPDTLIYGWQPTPLQRIDGELMQSEGSGTGKAAGVVVGFDEDGFGLGVERVAFPRPIDDGHAIACVQLSNQMIRCAVRTTATALPTIRAIVDDVPPARVDARVLQLCTGVAHACVLYNDSSVACWGPQYSRPSCASPSADLNIGCASVPSDLSFTSIACGGASTCGVSSSGSVRCWGAAMATVSAPLGVFTQVSLSPLSDLKSVQFACALSAVDASVTCWYGLPVAAHRNFLVSPLVPTARVRHLALPCTVRDDVDAALSPSIVCSAPTPTEIAQLVPANLTHAPMLDVALLWQSQFSGGSAVCLLLPIDEDATASSNLTEVRCFGDETFMRSNALSPPLSDLGPSVRALGVQQDMDANGLVVAFWAWRGDGSLLAWGLDAQKRRVLPTQLVDEPDVYRWKQFAVTTTSPHPAICGVLVNGTARCVLDPGVDGWRTVLRTPLLEPEDVLQMMPPNPRLAPDATSTVASSSVSSAAETTSTEAGAAGAAAEAATASSGLRFDRVHVSGMWSSGGDDSRNVSYYSDFAVCGLTSDARSVCWGPSLTPAALSLTSGNSSVLHLPPPWSIDHDGPQVDVCSVAGEMMVGGPEWSLLTVYALCTLSARGTVSCTAAVQMPVCTSHGPNTTWVLQLLSSYESPDGPGSGSGLSEIRCDPDKPLVYGRTARDGTMVVWNPFVLAGGGNAAPVPALPSLALQVAPQFFYRDKAGALLPCQNGTFSVGPGAVTPLCSGLCAKGYYGPGSSSTNNTCNGECPLGHYCPVGSATPHPCHAGSFGASTGLTDAACSGPCAVGSFTPLPGMTTCLRCPSKGVDCGYGHATIEHGHWALLPSPQSNGDDDADAGEGSSSFTPADVAAMGPWQCPPGFCNGAVDRSEGTLENPCSDHRDRSVDNPLCGRCLPGYHEWNGACTECPELSAGMVVLLLVLMLLAVAILLLTSQSAASHARFTILVYFFQTALLLLQSKSVSELARVFAFLHVFALNAAQPTGHHCPARMSAERRMLFEALLPLFIFALLTALVAARAMVKFVRGRSRHAEQAQQERLINEDGFAEAASSPASSSSSESSSRSGGRSAFNAYLRASITLGLTAYQQLVVSLLLALQCVDVGPHRVLFSAPSIDCTTEQYRGLQPLFVVLLLSLTVGVPALLGWFIYRHRDLIAMYQRAMLVKYPLQSQPKQQPYQAEKADDTTMALSDSSAQASSASVVSADGADPVLTAAAAAFAARYDGLFALFRPGFPAWLVVVLLRRVALITVAVLLLTQPAAQSLLFSVLCLSILLMHLYAQPYRHVIDNRLETASLLALLLLAQLLTYQGATDNGSDALPLGIQLLIGALLVIPLAALGAAAALAILHHPRVRALWKPLLSGGSGSSDDCSAGSTGRTHRSAHHSSNDGSTRDVMDSASLPTARAAIPLAEARTLRSSSVSQPRSHSLHLREPLLDD
jgi:hypothetical protein